MGTFIIVVDEGKNMNIDMKTDKDKRFERTKEQKT